MYRIKTDTEEYYYRSTLSEARAFAEGYAYAHVDDLGQGHIKWLENGSLQAFNKKGALMVGLQIQINSEHWGIKDD